MEWGLEWEKGLCGDWMYEGEETKTIFWLKLYNIKRLKVESDTDMLFNKNQCKNKRFGKFISTRCYWLKFCGILLFTQKINEICIGLN